MKRVKAKSLRSQHATDDFTVIMDRIQLRNELSMLVDHYGRAKVEKALSLLLGEIVRKAKP